jgi:SOS-response transcriptional repressor LexA
MKKATQPKRSNIIMFPKQKQTVESAIAILPKNQSVANILSVKVCGDSLNALGIFDGDNLICRKVSEAKQGQLVVAETDIGLVVKYFHRKGNRVTLRSAHSDYKDLVYNASEVKITAIVIGLHRNLEAA